MVTELVLRNVRIEGQGPLVDILLDNGIIAITTSLDAAKSIDCQGHSIFPGRIDMHVHDRYPSKASHPAENIESMQMAAIAGGTTTIAAMANTDPCITTADRFLEKDQKIQTADINYFQWGGATPTNYTEFEPVLHLPRFKGIKMCTAITSHTGEMLVDKKEDKVTVLKWAAEHGVLIPTHAENQARISKNEQRLRDQKRRLRLQDHCEVRDVLCEEEEVAELLEIAISTGCKLHLCHISSPRSVKMIQAARLKSDRITFEFCPQYWRFHSGMLTDKEGWRVKCNPAVRAPEDAEEMEALVCDESIAGAVLATDHAAHNLDKKKINNPDPFTVASGMPGVETGTLDCWGLVSKGKMSRKRFVDLTSRNPAQLLGLENKGEIKKGFDADLVLLDEGGVTEFRDELTKSRCKWTPSHGRTAAGQIVMVIVGGKIVLNNLK